MKKLICPFSNEEIDLNSAVRTRAKKLGLSREDYKYAVYLHNFGDILSKDSLIDKYEREKWSLPDFKRSYGINYPALQFCLKYHKIKLRGIKEANSLSEKTSKYKKTCYKKYGVSNVSKIEEVKEKKKQTFLKNYGVDNIWKSESYCEWLDSYMIDKFGQRRITNPEKISSSLKEFWASLSEEDKRNKVNGFLRNGDRSSKLEIRICEVLSSMKISYQRTFWIKNREFDFLILGTNILVEVNGDFWHANPNKYNAEDLVNFPGTPVVAKDIWKKDEKKALLAEKHGYNVVTIWEDFIRKSSDESLSKFIYNEIKKHKKDQK